MVVLTNAKAGIPVLLASDHQVSVLQDPVPQGAGGREVPQLVYNQLLSLVFDGHASSGEGLRFDW